jgi:putative ABC transport system permease protein
VHRKQSKPEVLRIETLWKLYVAHLRARPVHELFALAGIATGVALVFAVQVANTSIAGSVDRLIGAITGNASLEVAARDTRGFDEEVSRAVEGVQGVAIAAPLLQQRVALRGPGGERIVELVGATFVLAALDGSATRGFGRYGVRLSRALLLPTPVADAIGVGPDGMVTVKTRGMTRRARVAITLDHNQIGTLADSPIAVAPLNYVQELTGREGQLTRVLVQSEPGQDEGVRAQLSDQFGSIFNVRPSDSEARLIRQAAAPNDQSTSLFAAISAIVGLLFAFNAMLLTMPERRRLIAAMKVQGFSAAQIASMLVFQALILGAASALVGLLLGDLLSRWVFHSSPGYLSFAFPVGGQRIVSPTTVAVAVVVGLAGSLLAVGRPLYDLYRSRTSSSTPRDGAAPRPRSLRSMVPAMTGVVVAASTTLAVVLVPQAAIVGMIVLVAGMLLVLPGLLRGLVAVAWSAASRVAAGPVQLAVSEMRARATRGTALAATVAIAVFGSVAIEGAHQDLVRGLDQAAYGLTHTTDVWIAPGGDENTLTTMDFSFSRRTLDELRDTPGFADVRAYQGAFLDYGERRVWVIGRPAGDRIVIPEGQVVDGNAERAERLIRAGGWAAVSTTIADEHGLDLGESFTLPTPGGPTRLRLAAKLTNVGWAPGTVILNRRDFAKGPTGDPSAIEIDLNSGVSPSQGVALARAALGPNAALSVETAQQRWDLLRRNARQGLARLTQISTLVLLGAILATAAAMSAAVWQRRSALADLRVQGWGRWQVWTSLLSETALLLGFGCAIGAAFGLGGQLLLSRWLKLSTGFPADYSPAIPLAAVTFAIVALVALVVIAVPGYLAARVPLHTRFSEE